MVFLSFHKPPSLILKNREKRGWPGICQRNPIFFCNLLGQEIEWKIGGWYEELGFWLRLIWSRFTILSEHCSKVAAEQHTHCPTWWSCLRLRLYILYWVYLYHPSHPSRWSFQHTINLLENFFFVMRQQVPF